MEIKYSGFVSIAGLPNVGKSTLLNALMGEKLAIVSPRSQTTRGKVVGIRTEGDRQVVFIDTPGVHTPHNALGQTMNKTANEATADTDVVILVVNVKKGVSPLEEKIIKGIQAAKQKSILVINKVDLVKDKPKIMDTIAVFSALHEFDAVVPMSARNKKGLGILEKELWKLIPEGIAYYPEDMTTETGDGEYCAEIIREKILLSLSEEVPHGVAVEVYRMGQRDNDVIDIDVNIICEKDSHKAIIIGKGGEKIKAIATAARKEIEEYFGYKVNLQTWVKVRDDWRNDPRALRSLGFGLE